jgi:hypothetical protein
MLHSFRSASFNGILPPLRVSCHRTSSQTTHATAGTSFLCRRQLRGGGPAGQRNLSLKVADGGGPLR